MIKYHLSINGANRELFGVTTENEAYSTFVGAAQEAGLDEVLETMSGGAARLSQAGAVAQAALGGPTPQPWGQPPVPAFQQTPPQQQYQQPPMPAAAAQPFGPPPVCQHGTKVHRTGSNDRGTWNAWACPAPKGDQTQCKFEFIR